MRLIDVDYLLKELEDWQADLDDAISGRQLGVTDAMVIAYQIPIVDAMPVRHGKWILEQEEYDGYGYGNWNRWKCSCCGYVRTKGWAATSEGHKPKAMLCEKCGAKMDEESDNETS